MNALKRIISKPVAAAIFGAATLAVPASLAVPEAPAVASTQANDLDRAVRALRAITTMRADFVQTDRAGNALRGELTLRNPGRIRFEYDGDTNMLVVSDGRALTLVDYDVSQVERWPISNSPLGALLDPDRDMRRYGTLQSSGSDNVISVLVRDPNRPEFGTITLIFQENANAPGGLQLASWVALDSQNTRTTVRLRNHRYGMSVPNSAFTYRDPRRSSRRPG
ncbi:LolA family protein [Aurantiacibacter aquimixticola]|uniref:Outer membrane lipoprotein carrier protein LolA n=1 Tax=Aurantiacibacter aquimixticola TaxID=1958945 RepID=A0A419RUF6_9SPHN|nr:outer membrane lipoprotein carrier protein LolA [Aurantiacibacter aquimixticola]RJY09415.1 outer membrane lipoprotein carrier protein LolA [Aurantiacibacter aquimixticola]